MTLVGFKLGALNACGKEELGLLSGWLSYITLLILLE
jgi:hypothetical protein